LEILSFEENTLANYGVPMRPKYLNGDYSPNGMNFFLIFPKLGSRTGKLDDKTINFYVEAAPSSSQEMAVIKMKRLYMMKMMKIMKKMKKMKKKNMMMKMKMKKEGFFVRVRDVGASKFLLI
jgi:hypothetical protein